MSITRNSQAPSSTTVPKALQGTLFHEHHSEQSDSIINYCSESSSRNTVPWNSMEQTTNSIPATLLVPTEHAHTLLCTYWACPHPTGTYWAWQHPTGTYWACSHSTGIYWTFPHPTGIYWACPYTIGIYWACPQALMLKNEKFSLSWCSRLF